MSPSLSCGLIGAGWISSFHGETLARRLPGVHLAAVADPDEAAVQRISGRLSVPRHYHDSLELIVDPRIDAVAICSPASTHAGVVEAAAQAGKHVFCEKPIALTLADADRAIEAARAAGVVLQVGFNRRFAADFAAMRARIDVGAVGTPHVLRSLTRDHGISAQTAARVKPWTIVNETLIHDFDTLCWLNPGARVVNVYAQASALIHPQLADAGFLDTAVVHLEFDNGAFAVAEASFQAGYGYDVRAEVFGDGGVLLAGRPPGDAGTGNTELFGDAYVAQFAHFAECIRAGHRPSATGADARTALEIALAARESVAIGAPVALAAAVAR